MSIQGGSDQRSQVNNVTSGNFANVVAVDSPTPSGSFLPGSGYLIGSQHVLTAGHVVSTQSETSGVVANSRVTTSGNVAGLPSRANPPSNIPAAAFNVTNYNFIDKYNGNRDTDIALLTTGNLTTPSTVLGLLTFVDPRDARNLPIDTAGYPWNITQPALSVNTDPTGRTMYTSSGTVATASSNGRFTYSDTVDTEGGQSGSGVWVDVSDLPTNSFLSSATADLIVGVHTHGGSSNGGHLTEKANYDAIVAQMFADAGSAAAAEQSASQLPENVIVGSSPFSGIGPVQQGDGNDQIVGSYRKELILGRSGEDRLFGGGADDRLEGGDGVDQALFSDIFTNYDFTITDPSNPAFEFTHARGSQSDGTDTTKDIEFGVFEFVDVINNDNQKTEPDGKDDDENLFFVPLQVDPDDNTKLKDGSLITPEEDILDDEGNKIGTVTVESPAWMFDEDVNYTLTIGSELGILYNFAYIIDSSGSMFGTRIAQAKTAYQALTQSLIDDGIAVNSEFGVVDFDSSARLFAPLDAPTTISTINGLRAGGATNFNSALVQAINFFSSPSRNNNATNIAYFLSDGFNNGPNFSGSAAQLQQLAEVRAFGIGNPSLSQLNIVDSDNAVVLSNPADLITEFNAATVDKNTIERIDVKLGGTVVDTITSDQLVEDTLGLKFEGTIDGLEVTREAENEITFDLVFNDGTPTASLDYKITTGQKQVRNQTNNGTREVIIFSVNQDDFTGSAESGLIGREIIGNDLDNVIEVDSGENTIFGNGGNDRFMISGGINLIDGGEGIDTVEINQTQADAGGVSKSGNVVNIGTDNSLLNVEFIQFSDVRLAVDTLAVTPTLSLVNRGILIAEGDTGSTTATFTVNLSSTTTEDVVIDFTTRSDDADAGTDFVETTGQLTIAAGENSGDITVEILGDTDIEGDEAVFLDLSVVSGGTFADGAITETAGVNILDDDSVISIPVIGFPTLIEGDPGEPPNKLTLTLDRFGGLNGTDTIEVEIVAAGDNPAQASDFVNGFSSRQVTFAPGEDSKTIDISINPDQEIESDETFGVRLTSVSGSSLVPSEEVIFTILDDDAVDNVNNPPTLDDRTFSIAENSPNGTSVGTLAAIDTDASDTLTYAITSGNSDPDGDSNAAFAIDSTSGEITVVDSSDLDFETTPSFNLTVTVTDAAGSSDNAALIVNLTDINEDGTPGNDVITGDSANNIITGFQGRDMLTGNGGSDQFVYTNIRDAGDIITDFELGSDTIVLTQLLDSLGYQGSDAIGDGYVSFGSGRGDAFVQIDRDGATGTDFISRPLVLLQGVTQENLSANAENSFVF